MQFLKKTPNIDFLGNQFILVGISVVMILFSIGVFLTKGLQFGIDFAGGTEFNIRFHKDISSAELRKLLSDQGFKDLTVQHFGSEGKREYLIRLEKTTADLKMVTKDIEGVFEKTLGAQTFEIRKVEMVGPKVGDDLKKRGVWALFYSLLGILIYVALRFDYRYSPGGVVALIHDVIIALGVFAFLGKKFDLTILAAVLTIVGYSINDTIVIFDRIRDNFKKYQGMDAKSVINKSVNETLSRTFLTSFTVLLVVLSLYLVGGAVIPDFALVMLVGVIVGSYSSFSVASPLFLFLYNRFEKKA